MNATWLKAQSEVCERLGVPPFFTGADQKVGIARNVRERLYPLNGLRITPQGDTTGWYIWAGREMSDDPEFFVPLHVTHLPEWCPEIMPYLLLPPGWRFLIAPGHSDAWFDPALIQPA
jgi:hypothetical protein